MALSQAEIDAIGKSAGEATAKVMAPMLDERMTAQTEAQIAMFKTKFELVLAIDCTDEVQRDKARSAFRWLLDLNREEAKRNIDFAGDLRSMGRKGGAHIFLWALSALNLIVTAILGWLVSGGHEKLR